MRDSRQKFQMGLFEYAGVDWRGFETYFWLFDNVNFKKLNFAGKRGVRTT